MWIWIAILAFAISLGAIIWVLLELESAKGHYEDKLSNSFNYYFTNSALKPAFFRKEVKLSNLFLNDNKTSGFINKSLFICRQNINISCPKMLNYHFVVNDKSQLYGIVIELPQPTLKRECNYVALIACETDDFKIYYQNEYDESNNSYTLHFSTKEKNCFPTEDHPSSLNDFLKAIDVDFVAENVVNRKT